MEHSLKRFLSFSGLILGTFLLVFVFAEAIGFNFIEQVEQMDDMLLPLAALLGLALLAGDVFLPVPASLIMIAFGSLFGLAGGAALSLVGGVLAAVLGYYLGRLGKARFAKWFGQAALDEGGKLFEKHGLWAVIVSRPIPLISETIAVVAGSADYNFRRMLLGSFLGTLPAAIIYAWAGATLRSDSLGMWPFLIVFALASALFLIGRFRPQSQKQQRQEEDTDLLNR